MGSCIPFPLRYLISNRRSIRKFKIKDISKEDILKILDAGRKAPSAKNRQNWYFVVLQGRNKDRIAEKMLEYADNASKEEYERQGCESSVKATANVILQAPVLILVFKDKDDNWVTGDTLSIGACVENMLLTASDLCLGALWIRDTYCVADEAVKWFIRSYDETNKELCCAIAIGYADEKPSMRPRKDLEDVVDWTYSFHK